MRDEARTVEVRELDVDTAVDKGLAMLQAKRGDVEVEVLDRGSRGLLGLGSRDAVVRLTLRAPAVQPEPQKRGRPAARVVDKPPAPPPVPVPPPAPAAAPPVSASEEKVVEPQARVDDSGAAPEGEADESEVARDVVATLLEKMGITAATEVNLSEQDERTGRQTPIVSVKGDDLSVLIGPRGETLNALQFVSRIMAGHRLRRRSHLVIDVAGYRERRRQALSRLAERMAGKAIKRNAAVTLEPMPPYERRLIHIALRDHAEVYTESAGEGNRRRVRIFPKSD